MDVAAELRVNAAVYAPLALVAIVGVLVLNRSAGRWLPLPRLRPGRWSGGEVFLCLALSQIVPAFVIYGLDERGFFFWIFDRKIDPLRQLFVISFFILPLVLALHFTLLFLWSGTRPHHVGLTAARWRANVRLGLASFCLVTPAVLAVYILVASMTTRVPHEFEKLAQEGLHPVEWFLLAFQAIVAAPLLEEWQFRGLLQGWLRRASPLGHFMVALIALVPDASRLAQAYATAEQQQTDRETYLKTWDLTLEEAEALDDPDLPIVEPVGWDAPIFALIVVGIYIGGVVRLWWPVFNKGMGHFADRPAGNGVSLVPDADRIEGQAPIVLPEGPRWEAFKQANARWAIVGSATLFALLHPWPGAVALLPFGLVLGWLAHRTQSLLAGIVVHALFNAVAFGVLLISAILV